MNEFDWSALSIIVADDEEILREAIASVFENKGAKVYPAGDIAEAFGLFQKHKPDVVLSDIQMPGGSGLELLAQIRALHPDSPLVFLSTGFSSMTEAEVKRRGAAGLFTKPFRRAQMLEEIEKVLKSRNNGTKAG